MFSFRNKLILAFIFFGVLLITISSVLIFKMQELSLKAASIEKAQQTHEKLDKDIGLYIHEIKNSLYALENSSAFQKYLLDPAANKKNIKDFFSSFVFSSHKIYQYRYIDNEGVEKLRAQKKYFDKQVFHVTDDNLQNKKTRYYFQETINSDDEISYSRIDLNIENKVIEKPIKPVIRISKKVMHNGNLAGILVINVLMDEFIDNLVSSAIFDIFLIDKNGFFLAHPEKEKRWSLYLETNFKTEDVFASDAACILNNVECRTDQFYAKNIQTLNNPDGLKLIIQPRMYKIHKQMQQKFKDILYIYLAVLMLSFPIAYLFSITPTRLKNKVDQLNATLEKKVQEKVNELKDSNKILEEKVMERTRELEEANTKLYKQATMDSLTNIPNRRYFFEMSDRYLQLSHRKHQPLSFIIFDIDFFKKVNDTYGHETGDQVLKFITDQIDLLLRRSDIFARIGGEEFAIALLDTSLKQAAEIAEKLRKGIQNSTYISYKTSIKITISLGVTQAKENEQEVSFILSRADTALYQAKDSGRNQVVTN